MGIQLADDAHKQGWDVTTAVITDIQDNVIYFDNRTNNDYLSTSNGTMTNGCSIIDNKGDGIFRNNTVYANGDNGISIGHKDTDNIFENNHVYENGEHGILFRDENEQNSGHRNSFVHNIIENNGLEQESSGFYIGGETHDIQISHNTIRSTGKENQTAAIFIGRRSSRITSSDNQISGCQEIVREK